MGEQGPIFESEFTQNALDDFTAQATYIGNMNQPDDIRDAILKAALKIAPFEGWTRLTLKRAVRAAGYPEGADELYFEQLLFQARDIIIRDWRNPTCLVIRPIRRQGDCAGLFGCPN